jgi:3'(2'), 5'-bisphosphate nucleotidase
VQTVPIQTKISENDAIGLIEDLTEIIARACAVINSIAPDGITHWLKPDQSPVTTADEAAEATILDGLKRVLPRVPVIAEETSGRIPIPQLDRSFCLVDPLDGTKEFITGSNEFTVNLAIITSNAPVAGIIAAPKQNMLWRGIIGHRAERLRMVAGKASEPQPICTRTWPTRSPIAVVSRSHPDAATEAFLGRFEPIVRMSNGSAIKFCKLAEGSADIYPRLSTVCEWDVAAGHALLAAAGGIVTTDAGDSLTYGHHQNFLVPAFIAWGDPAKAEEIPRQSH